MTNNETEIPIFELDTVGIRAQGRPRVNGQFVVLAGSQARAQVTESFETASSGYRQKREQLIADGILIPEEGSGNLRLIQDVEFNGSTEAANVLIGRPADGTRNWFMRLPDGRKQFQGEWLRQTPELLGSLPMAPIASIKASWPPFFRDLARKLLAYQQRQPELIQVLRDAGISINHDEGEPLRVIDPFTFFSLILKHTSDAKALPLFARVGTALGVQAAVPTDLNGVPWSNPMNAWFFAYRSQRKDSDIPTLWELAQQAMAGELDAQTFESALKIRKVALPKLTQGLFWLNPNKFLALNGVNVPYLQLKGIKNAANVQTLAGMQNVLTAAARLAPDFPSLSHAAWMRGQAVSKVATLIDGHFPFSQFRQDALEYASNKVKGNMQLEQRYSPLLVELFQNTEPQHLIPTQSAYGGGQQLAVKVSLGGGVKTDSGAFGRALMFADESGFEYVRFPEGLTLEVGIPDGKGDGPRQALIDAGTREALLDAMIKELPLALTPTLTLNTDFGALQLLPLTSDRRAAALETLNAYVAGTGKSRRLRVGVSLTPEELESERFPNFLEAAVAYADELTAVLEPIARSQEALSPQVEPSLMTGEASVEALLATFEPPTRRVPLNQILYGPPGTGKTYQVVERALAILDPDFLTSGPDRQAMKTRYDEFVAQGAVSFVTFHQSFGYEDFIEGIKPVMQSGQLSYVLEDGIFLKAVRAAGGNLPRVNEQPAASPPNAAEAAELVRPEAQVWRIYIDGTAYTSVVRDRSVGRNEIRIGSFGKPAQDLNLLSSDELQGSSLLFRDGLHIGDLILLATGADRIGAVGVVTGEYRFDPNSEVVFSQDYAHARSVKWLLTGVSLDAQAVTGKRFAPPTLQRVNGVAAGDVLAKLPRQPATAEDGTTSTSTGLRPHVLIIDEINRGNVAKVFGELITLLESGKRAGKSEALMVTLPLSRRPLSVPQSLYVIGTMNTADRSLTQLDTALRRRFTFHPVWPEPEVLPVLNIGGNTLDLRKFLYTVNGAVERLLSREQVIGHAYLLDLPGDLAGVASALRERILPQLEEYFFDDWAKIREVLGDHRKDTALQFIQEEQLGAEKRYRINENAFRELEAFTLVYSHLPDEAFPFEV